jgi:hypothetical protein
MTNVFSDTAGTTPAVLGGAVARIDDKSPNGRNAVQATSGQRGLLGRAPVAGRRNLLTRTEEFGDAAWSRNGTTVTSNTDIAPDGNMTADTLIETATTGFHVISQNGLGAIGQTETLSFFAKPNGRSFVGSQIGGTFNGSFDIDNGIAFPSSGATLSIVAAGDGWFRCIATRVKQTNLNTTLFLLESQSTPSYTGDGTSGIFIWGAQLEVGTTATPYQRVGIALDTTEAGFPSPPFIRLDGVDDRYPTPYPDGLTGDVIVFGRKGSWLQRDVVIPPAGTLTVGPTTFNGAPAGTMAALGDIVGWNAVDRTLTDAEITRLLRYYGARGAKGLLAEGPELVVNGTFDTDVSGWTSVNGATLAWVAGEMEVTSTLTGAGALQAYAAEIGTAYKVSFISPSGGGTDRTLRVNVGSLPSNPVLADFTLAQGGGVFVATATTHTAYARNASPQVSTWDNISVRALTPQPIP